MRNDEAGEETRKEAVARWQSLQQDDRESGGQFPSVGGRAGYQSPSLRSLLVTAVLIAFAGVSVYAIVKYVAFIQLLNNPAELLTWADLLRFLSLAVDVGSLSMILRITSIAAIVVFFFWLYRASTNLQILAGRPAFTPGWTIIWFFIPIMNLWKPYEAVKEIHEKSDPGTNAVGGTGRSYSSTAIVGWWWALFLITSIGENGFSNVSPNLEWMYTMLGVEIVSVALVIVTVLMVRRISSFQDRKIELIAPV